MRGTGSEDRPIRAVATINLAAVAEALDDSSGETTWWYDPATGDIEMTLTDQTVYDEEYDHPADRGLAPIDPGPSRHAYLDMADFAESVADAHASDLLVRALEGRGAFRRFRETLREFPDLREYWNTYERAAGERRAIDWLLAWNYVDPVDADAARSARNAALLAVVTAVGSTGAAEFDEAVLTDRWANVRQLIDTGHVVNIHRGGKPWAVITPLSRTDRD